MPQFKLRKDVSYGLYGTGSSTPLLLVDLLYARRTAIYEHDAATVLAKIIRGETLESLFREIKLSSRENGDAYVKQTQRFLDFVLPLLFEGFGQPQFAFAEDVENPKKDPIGSTMRKTNYLYKADCEITHRCQLDCCHCYNPDHKAKNDMDTSEWIDAITQLRDQGVYRVLITGGDPFARKDVWEILEHIRSLSMSFDVLTNGQFLAERSNAEKLRDLYPHSVQCSVYASSSEVHDAITRGKGSFLKTIQCLKYFQEFNIPTVLKTPLMTLNSDEIIKLNSIAHDLRATHQVDLDIFPKTDGNQTPINYRLCKNKMVELLQIKHLPLFKKMERLVFDRNIENFSHDIICEAGRNRLAILQDGSLTPCLMFHLVCGNVKQNKINEILNGKIMKTWLSARRSQINGKCSRCTISKFCDFCPGISYLYHGDYLTGTPSMCELAQAQMEATKLLEENV